MFVRFGHQSKNNGGYQQVGELMSLTLKDILFRCDNLVERL